MLQFIKISYIHNLVAIKISLNFVLLSSLDLKKIKVCNIIFCSHSAILYSVKYCASSAAWVISISSPLGSLGVIANL